MPLFSRLCVLFVLAIVPFQVRAQSTGIERLETALAQGDAQTLTQLSADRVDVTLDGTTTTYSRAQVHYVLAGFFQSNPPEGFAFDHRMDSGEGAAFASGRYRTAGRTYQIMARMSRKDGAWTLRELRIEN